MKPPQDAVCDEPRQGQPAFGPGRLELGFRRRAREGRQQVDRQMINIAAFGFDQIAQLLAGAVKKAGFSVKITAELFPTVAATMNAGKQTSATSSTSISDSATRCTRRSNATQIKSGSRLGARQQPEDRRAAGQGQQRHLGSRAGDQDIQEDRHGRRDLHPALRPAPVVGDE